MFTYARFSPVGYEVSSSGDRRFSALYARLKDGRTIEEAYQLDVKGYRPSISNWKGAKGKPPVNGKSRDQLWYEYLALWEQWASENTELIEDLRMKAKNEILTDRFATHNINQARALACVLNVKEFRQAQEIEI